MFLWSACLFSLILGLSRLAPELRSFGSIQRERLAVLRVVDALQEFEECLLAGWVPGEERWDAIRALPDPWATLAFESLDELRRTGGAVLPTLKRLRALALEHESALGAARARSAQAVAQAVACAGLVPIFALALWCLLPGLASYTVRWILGAAVALGASGCGALWLFQIAEGARWGGLPRDSRSWALAAQCSGERFLALVRAGQPADLAWARSVELLGARAPRLADAWGSGVWDSREVVTIQGAQASEKLFLELGSSIRKAIQVSLMEGRPCTERVETALLALRQDFRSAIDRELSLLATRALKPLFFCVAPGLLGLLVYGIYLGWQSLAGEF